MTRTRFSASPGQVWDGLMFFEQIRRRPPLHLRLLLPAPMCAEGRRSAVGDETRCVYDKGYLLKRVTRIDPWRHYGFDVVEQELAIAGGIRLMGGSYTLLALPGSSTRIELETRYVSSARPRWLWRRIEAAVCHAFHRHILGAIQREVESRGSKTRLVRERPVRTGENDRSVDSDSDGHMRTAGLESLRPPTRQVLRAAPCAAAILLFAAGGSRAQELRVFPAAAQGPRYVSSLEAGGAAGLRIWDLERSYPWSETEERNFRLGIQAPTDPPAGPEEAAAPQTVQRCVLVQCVKLSPEPAPPKNVFTTPVTLWTAAALLGGIAEGMMGPIHSGVHGLRTTDEGFFQTWTYAGGSDKASHLVISASVTNLLYDAYTLNRLSPDQVFALSFGATLMAGLLVEIGDGLTPYGFSAQDLAADAVGSLAEALIKRNDLVDLLGFRAGSVPTTIPPAVVGDRAFLGIDYSREIYTADMRLGGLATRLHASPDIARCFLFSFVFMAKGYGYEPALPERYQEVGLEVGLNFPEILRAVGVTDTTWWGDFLLRAFNFFRIPFTQIGAYYNLKNQKWYGPGAPYHFY